MTKKFKKSFKSCKIGEIAEQQEKKDVEARAAYNHSSTSFGIVSL